MADVFGRTSLGFGGGFSTQKGVITSVGGLDGTLMQNLSVNYAQNVTRIWELGTSGQDTNLYYVGGRTQGTAQMGHILGPKKVMSTFYTTFSDLCAARTNHLNVVLANGGTDCNLQAVTYNCMYCVLTQIGMSVQASDLIINANSSLMFSNMVFKES